MELRKINTEDAKAQWEYTTALPADENGLTNPYHGVSYDEYVEKVLPALISYEHPVGMPDWFVPETYYYLWDGGSLIGEFRIRHYLTEALRNGAGHIGYSIRKDYRGKGYGTAGLKLTAEIAKTIVPEDEIYLRVNKDNIASQKVMLNNGAYRAGEDENHFFMRIPKTRAYGCGNDTDRRAKSQGGYPILLPPQTESLIKGFAEESKRILQDNLVGIYLHGSAVMGCFNPRKSDIDLIIVADRPLSDPVKRAYMDMVVGYNALAPAKGIEMSIVLRAVCKPFVYPTPFELHFSNGHLEWYKREPDDYIRKMNGDDKDLAAHFTIINNRGRCVYGAPVEDVFAEVPGSDYMDSIRYDIEEAPENITVYPMYLTLNLARVLAYQEEGLVLSKKEGGEWALRNLPAEYYPLIRDAMREYTESAEVDYDQALAVRYAEYMTERTGNASGNQGHG